MSTFHKKDAANKIIGDERGKSGHSIKKHLMTGTASPTQGITKGALEKRTKNNATKTVTAFNKPDGLTKAVKIAMNSPGYKAGTAQQMTVDLTPSKKTGKLPSVIVSKRDPAPKGTPKSALTATTTKMAATKAVVEFGPGGQLKRVFPEKASLQPQTGRTTPKPLVKGPAPTLSQIANKAPKVVTPPPSSKPGTSGKTWAQVASNKK